MQKFNISEGENELVRSLLIMKYDAKKTLSENISEQTNTFNPEEIFGKCINRLTFTPSSLGIDTPNQTTTKKINNWAKSIGETFSYELYRRSGWGSNRFDKIFTKCKPGKLSIGNTFQEDLDRYERDKVSLVNAPYFCFNERATQNRWDVPNDPDTKSPNYMNSLSQTFGTYDSCKILLLLKKLPKFDWDRADKEDWKKIFLLLAIGTGVAGGVATGPMATFLLLSSLAMDLGLASMEYYDGDVYDAGLTLAFGLIPFLHLPGVKQYSKTFLRQLHIKVLEAKVLGKYQKLTSVEKEALNNIIKNKDKIIRASNQYLKKEITNKFTNKINKIGLASFVKITRGLWKSYRWKTNNPFKSMIFEIAGVFYTYDQIATMSGLESKKIDSFQVGDMNNPKVLENLDELSEVLQF